MQHHISHKLRCDVGGDERIKRMRGTEGVPKAERAVINLSLRHLLDFKVGGHIAAIDIAHGVGLHQHMVETGIEDGLLLVGAFDVDAAEFTLPNVVSGFDIVVKIPALGFGQQVFPCAFVVDGRDGDFHDQFVAFFGVKTQGSAQSATIDDITIPDIQPTIHQQMLAERP